MAAAASATILIELMDALTPGLAKASKATAAWERSMLGTMNRMGTKMAGAGRNMSMGLTLPIGGALVALTHQLGEFEKTMLGVTLGELKNDPTKTVAENAAAAAKSAGVMREHILAVSKLTNVDPVWLGASAQLLAKAHVPDAVMDPYLKAAAHIHQSDPEVTGEDTTRLLNSFRTNLDFSADPAQHAKQITLEADKILLAAKNSKFSTGEYVTSMSRLLPLATAYHIPTEQLESMLGAASQAGITSDKAATSIRSFLLRAISPTAAGRAAENVLGVERSKFMDTVTPSDLAAANAIKGSTGGAFSTKGDRDQLMAAINTYKTGGEENQQANFEALTSLIASKAAEKGKTITGDQIETIANNAVSAASGFKDLPGYLKAVEDALTRTGRADLIPALYEGRQASNIAGMLHNDTMRAELEAKLKNAGGYGDLVQAVYDSNFEGQLLGLDAAWKRFTITIGETGVIPTMIGMLGDFAKVLESIPKSVLADLTIGLVGLAAAGPVLWAGGNVISAVAALASGIGALTGLGAVSALAASFGALGLAAGAAYLAYRNWDTISQSVFGKDSAALMRGIKDDPTHAAMSRIGSAVGDISGDLSHIVGSANDAIDALARLLGMDPGKSAMHEGFKLLVADLDFIANSVATILEGLHTALAAIPGVAKSVMGAKTTPEEQQAMLNLAKAHFDAYDALHKQATAILDGGKAMLGIGHPNTTTTDLQLQQQRNGFGHLAPQPFVPLSRQQVDVKSEVTGSTFHTITLDATQAIQTIKREVALQPVRAGRFNAAASAPNLSRQNDHGSAR